MKDSNGNLKTLLDRESIEAEILQYNNSYFQQAKSSNTYKNKIYKKLNNGIIKRRIIVGTLRRSECDYHEVYEFLKLLKKLRGNQSSYSDIITEEIFVVVVRKSKKRSTSSIFLNRMYIIYKYIIEQENVKYNAYVL